MGGKPGSRPEREVAPTNAGLRKGERVRRIRARSCLAGILGAVLAATLVGGCTPDHYDDATPASGPPSNLPATSLLAHGEFDLPPGQGSASQLVRATLVVGFTSPTLADELQVRVVWTHSSDAIAVGVYPAGCARHELGVDPCKPLAFRFPPLTNTENLVHFPSAPPGDYVLGIQNRGPKAQSGAYQVVRIH
jgi:hypothetical protein